MVSASTFLENSATERKHKKPCCRTQRKISYYKSKGIKRKFQPCNRKFHNTTQNYAPNEETQQAQ